MPIPFLIVGDAPNLPTGLGRIARDVAERVNRHIPEVRVAQLGLYSSGVKFPWHVYPLRDEANWGQRDIAGVWEDHAGQGEIEEPGPGVVMTFWDPGRCPAMVWGLEEAAKRKWDAEGRAKPKLWGYFAVDAEDSRGAIGGPARAALAHGYDRLLAYTPYGKGVLGRSLEGRSGEIGWLPHGIELEVFQPQCDAPEQFQETWAESGWPVIGCVATNTPRKDLGTLFAALEGVECHLWLHTDRATTSAWSVQELARQFGRSDPKLLHVSGVEGPSSDEDLARWYSVCAATYAPGLGEGFCYPGVEALACGTPVVGLDYAGLPEFIPEPRWRVKPAAWRLEGAYAIKRPVADVEGVRKALLAAAGWKAADPLAAIEYCRISVAHLGWEELWPWWEKWIREGLETL